MGSFADQVGGIHGLLDDQKDRGHSFKEAIAQIVESSWAIKESLDTIHSIVDELVQQSDGRRQEVWRIWGERRSPEGEADYGT